MSTITVLDGGMGKELRRIGAPFRQPEWSALALIEGPDFVVQAHTNFVEAGADVITTNNYAVVPYHLGDDVMSARGAELTALAGSLARQAADAAPHDVDVAGSLPPLFGSYEPERFDPERAPALYELIVDALDPFVDVWLAETFSTTAELDAVAAVIRRRAIRRPLWTAFALPEHWDDGRVTLRSGESIGDLVDAVGRCEGLVEAVLFNCSLPEQIGPALHELGATLSAAGLDVRIGGYANAFPETRHDRSYAANAVVLERRLDLSAVRYADVVAGWVDDGATIIGGCCDMYPEHIAALADRFVGDRAR